MEMKVYVRNEEECPISRWSGGSTTEFFLYPPEASYGERNFLFRISSATVELEQSDFTHLPGIHRILMVLEKQVRLEIEGEEPVTLTPYDQVEFDGGASVRSCGACRDYNLMMAGGCVGTMQKLAFDDVYSHEVRLPRDDGEQFTTLYAARGGCTVRIENTVYLLKEGGFLCAEGRLESLVLSQEEGGQAVLTTVFVR